MLLFGALHFPWEMFVWLVRPGFLFSLSIPFALSVIFTLILLYGLMLGHSGLLWDSFRARVWTVSVLSE